MKSTRLLLYVKAACLRRSDCRLMAPGVVRIATSQQDGCQQAILFQLALLILAHRITSGSCFLYTA